MDVRDLGNNLFRTDRFRRFTSATERETRLVLRGRSPTITAIDAATFRLGPDVALVHV